jgi:hypothetical protein
MVRLLDGLRRAPRRFWRWATDPANNRLVWGYSVWGAMGVVVAVPELLAAVASKDVPFPTISGTVGYIEYWHPEFALLVIGLLVWAAFHAIRVSSSTIPRIPPTQRSREEAPTAGAATAVKGELVRIPGGRLSVASEFQPLHPRVYVPLALGVVALVFTLVRIARPHDKYLLGEVLYGSIALVWIAIPAWLAYKHGRWVPYATLFRTIQDLESHLRSARDRLRGWDLDPLGSPRVLPLAGINPRHSGPAQEVRKAAAQRKEEERAVVELSLRRRMAQATQTPTSVRAPARLRDRCASTSARLGGPSWWTRGTNASELAPC